MFTSDDLLTSVKLKSYTPANSAVVTDTELLSLADDELRGIVAPLITSGKGGYFEYVYEVAVSGTEYKIPPRAIGARIAYLALVQSGMADQIVPITSYQEPDARLLNGSTSQVVVAYIRGNYVVFNQTPVADSVKMVYYLRPNALVAVSSTATIASKTSTSITLSTTISGLSTGTLFDIVSSGSPFNQISIDQAGTVSGTTISGLTVSSNVSVGDYVALAQQSPVPNIPADLHPALIQRVVARLLDLRGDTPGVQRALLLAQQLEEKAVELLFPRIDRQNVKIVNNSLNRNWTYPWRWW